MAFIDREKKLAYQRRWYAENAEHHKANCAARAKIASAKLQQEVRDIKEFSPCTDCKRSYPYYVMQFDHVRGIKIEAVARMLQQKASRKRVMAEIAKCELVCSNCHAIRTHGRLAQAVERRAEIAEVGGAAPSAPTAA